MTDDWDLANLIKAYFPSGTEPEMMEDATDEILLDHNVEDSAAAIHDFIAGKIPVLEEPHQVPSANDAAVEGLAAMSQLRIDESYDCYFKGVNCHHVDEIKEMKGEVKKLTNELAEVQAEKVQLEDQVKELQAKLEYQANKKTSTAKRRKTTTVVNKIKRRYLKQHMMKRERKKTRVEKQKPQSGSSQDEGPPSKQRKVKNDEDDEEEDAAEEKVKKGPKGPKIPWTDGLKEKLLRTAFKLVMEDVETFKTQRFRGGHRLGIAGLEVAERIQKMFPAEYGDRAVRTLQRKLSDMTTRTPEGRRLRAECKKAYKATGRF